MDKNFTSAKWIWCKPEAEYDEYGEFYTEFDFFSGECKLFISSDSNYTAYVNGSLAAFGQYADYPYDKVYDEVDISEFCRKGTNKLAITVWYLGTDSTQVYYPGNAGLLFRVASGDKTLAASSEGTLSRLSKAYVNHKRKIITNQLGYSYSYDVTAEDAWKTGELHGFSESVAVEQELPLRPRPCEKLVLEKERCGKLIKRISDKELLFDLGTNTVGFLSFEAFSAEVQNVLVAYGEHIADGRVRRLVGGRDFSAELRLKKGENHYENTFRRFGCRYIEVISEAPLDDVKVAIFPTSYPLNSLPTPQLSKSEREIYDICINTLKLCMHEHYEDCPWREQALYAMDSRNQMLCGYYAFGEVRFPRACLELMSRDNREDGLLSICYPIKKDLVIPSFSLHYFTEVREYLDHSGDIAFAEEIFPKLESILKAFTERQTDGGLILPFVGKCYWNFYEWRNALDGHKNVDISVSDLVLNTLLSVAFDNMEQISVKLGKENTYGEMKKRLNKAITQAFFDTERGLFTDRVVNGRSTTFSTLGNALAILAGCVKDELLSDVCRKLTSDNSLTPISLSMKCFLYDALLKADKERYTKFILDDIEKTYRPMVDLGVGTVWETEIGEADFSNAGSLCHGWSALPVYYYHILK